MKRSEINKALKELEAMCAREHCYLPPFCHFTPEEWQSKGHEYDEVRDCMLGWDSLQWRTRRAAHRRQQPAPHRSVRGFQ